MKQNRVYIAMGCNLGQPTIQAQQAIHLIRQLPHTQLLDISSFYRTTPLGPQEQPDYLNAVLSIETALSPRVLLKALQSIETQLGRVRNTLRWGARLMDLDILLYANQIISSEELTIPHYDMSQRAFVLYPLYQIAPELILPNGTTLQQLLQELPEKTAPPLWEERC